MLKDKYPYYVLSAATFKLSLVACVKAVCLPEEVKSYN